jgi:protein SCO1/2
MSDVTETARSSHRRRGVIAVLSALGLLVLAGWLAVSWITPHPYSGTVLQAPEAAPSMDGLVLDDGSEVDLTAFEGQLLLVYFGYMSCPDVCPTTLSMAASARRALGDDADRVRLLMISVDPERDSLDALGDYVRSFDGSFVAATGDLDTLDRVAAQYGIFFGRGEKLGDEYAVDHTATLMGIDANGHLRIVWPAALELDRLVADMRELL